MQRLHRGPVHRERARPRGPAFLVRARSQAQGRRRRDALRHHENVRELTAEGQSQDVRLCRERPRYPTIRYQTPELFLELCRNTAGWWYWELVSARLTGAMVENATVLALNRLLDIWERALDPTRRTQV